MPEAKIGIIGGSGLYEMRDLEKTKERRIPTPFGNPSDAVIIGELDGIRVAFLPRHGKGHRIQPTEVPFRANIYALKSLGVEFIIAVNSVGSLKEDIKPGDIVIPDQLIDRTRSRVDTFFGNGIVAHILLTEPFCPLLSQVLCETVRHLGATLHKGGTSLVVEGPALSTKAESYLYESWGASIIGMTMLPEAKLAREAEICYAAVAGVTDYAFSDENSIISRQQTIRDIERRNTAIAQEAIKLAVSKMPEKRNCKCATSLRIAIETPVDVMPNSQRRKLDLLIGKYLSKN